MTMIRTSVCLFFAVVVGNCLEFEKSNPGPLGYPKDLICQRHAKELQRSPLECALKCLRSECVVWTSDTSETTCVVCGQCDSSGDILLANATDVYRSLSVMLQGKTMECCKAFRNLLGPFSPDSKVHGAYMGPTWGRQDPGGAPFGPMNLAIRETMC